MKYLLLIFFVFLAFLLQGRISVLSVPPNLTLIIVYYTGIKYGETKGMLTGLAIGAIEDSLSSTILGPNMLSKGIVGVLASLFITGGVFRWTPLLGLIAVSMLTLLDDIVVFLSKSIFYKIPAAPSKALFISIMQSLLNAFAGLFIKPSHVE